MLPTWLMMNSRQRIHAWNIAWNFGKKNTCHSLKYHNLWKGIFKSKCYQEPLACFIEIAHFGCFDVSIIMWDWGGKYGLKGSMWVIYGVAWGVGEFLVWTRYCKKFKLLDIYILKEYDLIFNILLKLRFSQPVIWKMVFDVVCHIERQKKM